jgi:hypothetical protein
MELLRLLFLKACSISWNWAGVYGISVATLVLAIAVIVSTVIAEIFFGQSGDTDLHLNNSSTSPELNTMATARIYVGQASRPRMML